MIVVNSPETIPSRLGVPTDNPDAWLRVRQRSLAVLAFKYVIMLAEYSFCLSEQGYFLLVIYFLIWKNREVKTHKELGGGGERKRIFMGQNNVQFFWIDTFTAMVHRNNENNEKVAETYLFP